MRYALCYDDDERIKRRSAGTHEKPRLHIGAARYVSRYAQHAGRDRYDRYQLVGGEPFLENYRAEDYRYHRATVVNKRGYAHAGVFVRPEQQHPV